MTDMSSQLQPGYQPRPWTKPIVEGAPPDNYEHDPRARILISRFLNNIPAAGVCHNTCDEDMHAVYTMAHIAARRALLHEGRILCLEHNVHDPLSIHFVEIGTWCGESAIMTASAVFDVVRRYLPETPVEFNLWLVDTFEGTPTDHNESVVRGWGSGDSVLAMCEDNVRQLEFPQEGLPLLNTSVHIVRMASTEAAQQFAMEDEPWPLFDYAYIDAGHSWKEVTDDIEAWFPLIRPGCWLAGHDYNASLFPGVIVAVDQQAQKLGQCSPIAFPGTAVWGFRKPPVHINDYNL